MGFAGPGFGVLSQSLSQLDWMEENLRQADHGGLPEVQVHSLLLLVCPFPPLPHLYLPCSLRVLTCPFELKSPAHTAVRLLAVPQPRDIPIQHAAL